VLTFRIVLLLSLVLRNAQNIDASVLLGDVIAGIADALRDQFRNPVMKRRLLAAMG
jgi:hypothetical protein